jgi:hypothetical protein
LGNEVKIKWHAETKRHCSEINGNLARDRGFKQLHEPFGAPRHKSRQIVNFVRLDLHLASRPECQYELVDSVIREHVEVPDPELLVMQMVFKIRPVHRATGEVPFAAFSTPPALVGWADTPPENE